MGKIDLSLIIPTYNEKLNISILLSRVFSEFKKNKISGEVIVVDDNSPDGTGKIVENLRKKYPPLRIVHRKEKKGLSSAVIEGFEISKGKILGVIDSDLSHPPKKIVKMFNLIKNKKTEFVIGSRYVRGGKIVGWNLHRKILSKGAIFLAKLFTPIKDPMTGFFMLKKDLLKNKKINSKGFKILLEILLKTKYERAIEIPITFTNRTRGKSKAGIREIFYYLKNIIGYRKNLRKIYKEFLKYALIGFSGIFVNLLFLYFLTDIAKIYYLISSIFSFSIATTWNYFFNKIWTFEENLKDEFKKKYFKFFVVSIFALGINTLGMYIFTEIGGIYYLFSQILTAGFTLIVNYTGNKFWTFKKF